MEWTNYDFDRDAFELRRPEVPKCAVREPCSSHSAQGTTQTLTQELSWKNIFLDLIYFLGYFLVVAGELYRRCIKSAPLILPKNMLDNIRYISWTLGLSAVLGFPLNCRPSIDSSLWNLISLKGWESIGFQTRCAYSRGSRTLQLTDTLIPTMCGPQDS